MSRKLILDLDTGIDDALAIAYALGSPEAELIGITATYGNVLMERSVRNSLAVLDILGASSVPVHPGLPHSSTTEDFSVQEISAFIHGRNGVGEVDIAPSPLQRRGDRRRRLHHRGLAPLRRRARLRPHRAADQPRRRPGEGPGPGRAPQGRPHGRRPVRLRERQPLGRGQYQSGPRCRRRRVPLRHRRHHDRSRHDPADLLTYEQTRRWRELGTPAGVFLADMTDYYIKAYETTAPGLGGCGLHDPLAVAVAVDPTLVTAFPINLQVDVEGPTRGRTIGDANRLNDPRKTSRAALGVDVDRFLEEFMSRITSRLRAR